ncbi:MAG: D-glycero-beta-D-manno-heptose-7-phosphate kinase [Deltaproteobacteria bacterium]|nr:D-glycero-beta-D-manno-heptose-7-phosphate kinase [Deltaproteobacteria bacterium]MBW2309736.1 D-glycero-beta-D-manno-heptose-7-phosphate kinase [Deltaproteobacteria bacterium]
MRELDPEQLQQGIENFRSTSILVIGDIMLDRFIWGKVSRISPEAPVPVVEVEHESTMLGGAANVVNNLISLGSNVLLCGVVGDDRPGEEVLRKLEDMGVDIGGIAIESAKPTSVKTRIVAHAQQVVRYDREKRIPLKPATIKYILDFIRAKKDHMSAMILSDYGKGVLSRKLMHGIAEAIAGSNIPVAVDPNVKNFSLYKDVTVITPNNTQAGEITGMDIKDENDLVKAGKRLMNRDRCKSLLITRGEEGMTLFEENGEITQIKSIAKKVYDVTGAGDTVIAAFTLGIASGLDMKSAAFLSNLAAGIVVGEVGTSAVKIDVLKRAVDSYLSR